MAECRSCDAPIRWALTEAGKRIPLDAEPNPDGRVELHGAADDGTPIARFLKKGEGDTLPGIDAPDRYMPHHATCPDAEKWRR